MQTKRRLIFRLLAVLIGFSPLIGFEAICHLNGWGRPGKTPDPFVGFSSIRPLFELNSSGDKFEIPESRQSFFRPESFAAAKAPNEFRVFCLGGSTVQGRPYAIETSFTSWLELTLSAADPSNTWQVVNCGGVSYASYRLVPILEEVLNYAPDLVIVCTGHNEFLEDRTYSEIRDTPEWQRVILNRITQLRTYGVISNLVLQKRQPVQQTPTQSPTLPTEVDALLDYKGGLEQYQLDDQWKRGVVVHFETNIRRMVRIARKAELPLVFINPVSNLRNTPPFKCETQPSLPLRQQVRFQSLWNAAKEMSYDEVGKKTQLVLDAMAIDDRYADAYFLLGRCYEATGDHAKAKTAYERAKDEDLCPLRMLESMHEILADVCASTNTPMVDARQIFETSAKHGIIGDDQLIDHVHPRIRGHQRIADAIFDQFVQMKIIPPLGNRSVRDELFRKHLDSLPPGYFPMGMERLNGLKIWAEGRVERTKPLPP